MEILEKRLGKRTDFRKPVEFELSAIGPGQDGVALARQGRGIDISYSGMGLETDYPPAKGSMLKLLIPLAGTEARLPVLARVQWVVAGGLMYRAGVQFLA